MRCVQLDLSMATSHMQPNDVIIKCKVHMYTMVTPK